MYSNQFSEILVLFQTERCFRQLDRWVKHQTVLGEKPQKELDDLNRKEDYTA
jgi:hypothetical protein